MKLTDKHMRAAVLARDPAMDGRFIYGVVTTGVYCRPACRSRTPRPENLRFFADAGAAAAAGFRACKRCRPNEAADAIDRPIFAVAQFLLAEPDSTAGLADLARRAHMSPAHFQRRFKKALGVSPREFRQAARLGRLRQLLRGRGEVGRALLDAGFASPSDGYRAAQSALGMTPTQFRRGARGEEIEYLAQRSALGWLMIAATRKGVCFAQFGDSQASLRRLLAAEFPQAALRDAGKAPPGSRLHAWMAALLATIGQGAPLSRLPLDLRGTAFQIRVWGALQRIAAGETRSYGEVAQAIHEPRSIRAVASACARNRIAVLVPCHRVLRGDGALAGYRWGLPRKRALLRREAQPARGATKAV
jgi:AraC family transcriptional regulator of adaptative response/methylated-DNA-[protein]-cysteine methyltransferase